MATSSASLAASILKDLSGANYSAATKSAIAADSATARVPVPIPVPTKNPDMRPPPVTTVQYVADNDGWGYGDDDEYDDSMPFDSSGQVSHLDRLRGNFALFGLEMSQVFKMMQETSMVIGGGFMVNHILAMNGLDKPLSPAADLDFYVFGGICPIFSGPYGGKQYRDYLSKSIQARTFQSLVTHRFYELVSPLGYKYTYPYGDDDYGYERTETGDRVFTSGSNIRMSVLYYVANINGVEKRLNLVFCDTDMYTFITKVDISLTAGFFCPSAYSNNFDYHHAAPKDVIEHRLAWLQPESTHTARQNARMIKYRERYDLLEQKKMTTAEFVRDWDELPDEHMHVTLVGTEDEIYSRPVINRVQGLPRLKFSVEMKHTSILGECTTCCKFPTASEIAEYRRHKARTATAAASTSLGQRPSLVVHDDDDDA